MVQKTYLEANQAIEECSGALNSSLSLAQENLLLRKKAFTKGFQLVKKWLMQSYTLRASNTAIAC
ncbi:hypothetical protein OK016_00560 [Vibrio chagasii]|nr:hypothetical protein [Vibrio chagasii]